MTVVRQLEMALADLGATHAKLGLAVRELRARGGIGPELAASLGCEADRESDRDAKNPPDKPKTGAPQTAEQAREAYAQITDPVAAAAFRRDFASLLGLTGRGLR